MRVRKLLDDAEKLEGCEGAWEKLHDNVRPIIEQLLTELEAKTAQVERLRTAMERILQLARDRTTRPWRLREEVAAIAAGVIAVTGLDTEETESRPALDYSGKYCRHGSLAPCIGVHLIDNEGSWCASCERCSCDIFGASEQRLNTCPTCGSPAGTGLEIYCSVACLAYRKRGSDL